MSIKELRQTSENEWKAIYNGNYGVYTIKVTIKGGKAVWFSCTCPSDNYPCKHIAFVEKAIAEKSNDDKKTKTNNTEQFGELLNNISADELKAFIAEQAKYNPELQNAILLEFTAKIKNQKSNKYSAVIRNILDSASMPEEDYYLEDPISIDGLEQWIDKAEKLADRRQYDEAILICKAIIEEFSLWLYETPLDEGCYFSRYYYSVPFDVFKKSAEYACKKELFDYCRSEVKKKKYENTQFFHYFQDLLGSLALAVDPDAFLEMQDKLLAAVFDKSSRQAEIILFRKIELYENIGEKEKAWEIIEANIQIPNFRMKAVENRIAHGNYSEAKNLINEMIAVNEGNGRPYSRDEWHNLLLDIAQKEKDNPAIQRLAYGFLKDSFDTNYFQIYKSTFNSNEWAAKREKLFFYYGSKRRGYADFSNSAADLLVAENESERLLQYVSQHLTLRNLEAYHKHFSDPYPEKTLELFRLALTQYTEQNTGRTHYEYILEMLKKMACVKDGKTAAAALAADLKARYKNRRAMIETLNHFK